MGFLPSGGDLGSLEQSSCFLRGEGTELIGALQIRSWVFFGATSLEKGVRDSRLVPPYVSKMRREIQRVIY